MKFNPFEPLTPVLLASLRKKGKRWLVSQTMDLSSNNPLSDSKIFLLMTHYEDQGMATVHLKAVLEDKFASLIDLEKEVHRRQLEKILSKDSRYIVYSSLITNKERAEKMASELYKEKYWKFIQQHSRAGITSNKHLRPSIQLIFGEIFVVLKYGSETMRTRLSEIEKL